MVIVMATAQKVVGHFSEVLGNSVRHVYSEDGQHLGIIRKLSNGLYRCHRTLDGKVRDKETLQAAFRTIRRQN